MNERKTPIPEPTVEVDTRMAKVREAVDGLLESMGLSRGDAGCPGFVEHWHERDCYVSGCPFLAGDIPGFVPITLPPPK